MKKQFDLVFNQPEDKNKKYDLIINFTKNKNNHLSSIPILFSRLLV